MLYVKESSGEYALAAEDAILDEARRLCLSRFRRGEKITLPSQAKETVRLILAHHESEVFGCLFLDCQLRVIEWIEMFRGTVTQASIYPREVIKEALRLNAAAVILAHNHPSGDSEPSQKDIELTKVLKDTLHWIDVKVVDHLIVGEFITSMAETHDCLG